MGNVFHDALKYFSDTVEKSEYGWFRVPEDKRTEWMGTGVGTGTGILRRKRTDRAGIGCLCGGTHDTDRSAHGLGISGTVEKRAPFCRNKRRFPSEIWNSCPAYLFFCRRKKRMRLQGRIDRIDVCREEGNLYVRVIDYKSGAQRFDLRYEYLLWTAAAAGSLFECCYGAGTAEWCGDGASGRQDVFTIIFRIPCWITKRRRIRHYGF